MLLWVFLAVMTGAAVLAVLWPLSRSSGPAALDGDEQFYRAQLSEIDHDKERGLIGGAEAEAARTESGRRLLRAAAFVRESSDVASEPALRRRRAASALALCVVPIVGLGVYGGYGSPELQGKASISAAGPAAEARLRFDDALKKVEAHLANNPSDARGWDVVAPIYLRVERYADAARAYSRARATGGDTAARLLGEAEARIALAKGLISPEATSLLRQAVERDPSSVASRYYLALAAEQSGDREGARGAYRRLLAEADEKAPWTPLLRDRLSHLEGRSAPSVPTIAAANVTPEINAMVGGLDERLKENGGSEAEWSRLVRSLVVLGRRDDASDRLAKAKAALASDPGAPDRLDRLAGDLGIPVSAGPSR